MANRFFTFSAFILTLAASQGASCKISHAESSFSNLVPQAPTTAVEATKKADNPSPVIASPADGEPNAGKEKDNKELLAKLASETDQRKAARLEKQIKQIWVDSGSPTINLMMGWSIAAILTKNYGKALDILDYVTVLDPTYVEGWNRRAYVYYNMKNYGLALDDMRRALQLDPNRFDTLIGLAALFQSMERNKQALEIWYKVLEIYPANPVAQKAVVELEEKISLKGI